MVGSYRQPSWQSLHNRAKSQKQEFRAETGFVAPFSQESNDNIQDPTHKEVWWRYNDDGGQAKKKRRWKRQHGRLLLFIRNAFNRIGFVDLTLLVSVISFVAVSVGWSCAIAQNDGNEYQGERTLQEYEVTAKGASTSKARRVPEENLLEMMNNRSDSLAPTPTDADTEVTTEKKTSAIMSSVGKSDSFLNPFGIKRTISSQGLVTNQSVHLLIPYLSHSSTSSSLTSRVENMNVVTFQKASDHSTLMSNSLKIELERAVHLAGMPWVQKRPEDEEKSARHSENEPTEASQRPAPTFQQDLDSAVDIEDPYYAFDDDFVRGNSDGPSNCRRTSFHRLYYPTCNNLHEYDLVRDRFAFLESGEYRDAFLVESSPSFSTPFLDHNATSIQESRRENKVVFKKMTLETFVDITEQVTRMEMQRIDALIMILLVGSPRTVELYGHCAMASIIEYMPIPIDGLVLPINDGLPDYSVPGQEPNEPAEQDDEIIPLNDIPVLEKLRLSLEVAECISDMHGFDGGVLVHGDVYLSQFMRGTDGVLKSIDFNRAEVLLYDDVKQAYCRYRNGKVYGDSRAPEEIADDLLTEKIDVYSLGNIFYSILTGLEIYFYLESVASIQESIKFGITPFLNDHYRSRSYGEAALVDLIRWCWKHNPDKRPDIFKVVEYLKRTIRNQQWIDSNDVGKDAWMALLSGSKV